MTPRPLTCRKGLLLSLPAGPALMTLKPTCRCYEFPPRLLPLISRPSLFIYLCLFTSLFFFFYCSPVLFTFFFFCCCSFCFCFFLFACLFVCLFLRSLSWLFPFIYYSGLCIFVYPLYILCIYWFPCLDPFIRVHQFVCLCRILAGLCLRFSLHFSADLSVI